MFLVLILLPAEAAAATLSNFTAIRSYTPGLFTDVKDEWFAPYVKNVYEYGLFDGTSPTTFAPAKNLTIAEAIKLASCLHSIYYTGSSNFQQGNPWYQTYVDYALNNGIIASPYQSYTAYTTRADFAVILAKALPDEALTPMNTIDDNQIPTSPSPLHTGRQFTSSTGPAFSRAATAPGRFTPTAISPVTPLRHYRLHGSSVLKAEGFARDGEGAECDGHRRKMLSRRVLHRALQRVGKAYASGSGFFISSSGVAVTNYHVIKDAASAKIMTTDGKTYDVTGVYDYSVNNDLALLQINGANFPYLEPGDASKVVNGQKIYAIGSPKGLDNTITEGIVSNKSRLINGVSYIQISAPISQGSSGGALIDTSGKVIGVTAAGVQDAQNINFAIPISLIKDLKQTSITPLSAAATPQLKVTPSQTSVTVALGAQVTITAKPSSDDYDSMGYLVDDESIITCNYAGMQGNAVALTITGIAVGRTSLSIALLDSDDNILAETIIDVTVTMPVVRYYSGYGSVPDFGAFTGAPLAKPCRPRRKLCYYYRVEAIPVDPKLLSTVT